MVVVLSTRLVSGHDEVFISNAHVTISAYRGLIIQYTHAWEDAAARGQCLT